MAISALKKIPSDFKILFLSEFRQKNFKRKLKFHEIQNYSWVRTDLKGFQFLDKKITHVFRTFVFWNIQFLAKITEILKTEAGLRKTDSLKSEIFLISFDLNWSH